MWRKCFENQYGDNFRPRSARGQYRGDRATNPRQSNRGNSSRNTGGSEVRASTGAHEAYL